jgi:integrase
MTAYAAGLRVSEVTGLRVADIDSQRMVIRIRQAKGQKDRFVGLSPRLLEILRQYWKAARPRNYLFPGARPDQPLSASAVHHVCRQDRRRCGLDKRVTVHSLRHNADSRIMPTETLVLWFFRLFPRSLESPLAKTTRHNPDILPPVRVQSARNEALCAQSIAYRC